MSALLPNLCQSCIFCSLFPASYDWMSGTVIKWVGVNPETHNERMGFLRRKNQPVDVVMCSMGKARLIGKDKAPQRFPIDSSFQSEAKVKNNTDLGLKCTLCQWHTSHKNLKYSILSALCFCERIDHF
jgi:hypothetical protein